MNKSQNKRDFFIDNSKAILIFLVVLSHLFECCSKTDFKQSILLIMYSFHMPLFVYFSGYLAKYDPKKIIKNILVPYLMIEIISYVFYNIVFGTTEFHLIVGYTSLWYMISLFTWYLLIPLLDGTKYPKLTLLFCLFLGLLIGHDGGANATFSISRTVTFLPFFAFGFYTRKYNWFKHIDKNWLKIVSIILTIAVILVLIKFRNVIRIYWFYGYGGYKSLGFNCLIRFLIYLVALIWLMFFKAFIPNKKLFISKIGKNSLSVYLLHYLVVMILYKTQILYVGNSETLNCLLLAVIITLVLSTNVCNKIFKKLFCKSYDDIDLQK